MSSSFFQNRDCEYFPCHETARPDDFNCLFCYCPLYALGRRCAGNFIYNSKGIKDCSACRIPHERKNYRYILSRYPEIQALVARSDEEANTATNAIDRVKADTDRNDDPKL